MSMEMGLQPPRSPTTEAPINLQKHMRIYIWPRVNVRIVSLMVRGGARETLFRAQGGYLLAFADAEQNLLLRAPLVVRKISSPQQNVQVHIVDHG